MFLLRPSWRPSYTSRGRQDSREHKSSNPYARGRIITCPWIAIIDADPKPQLDQDPIRIRNTASWYKYLHTSSVAEPLYFDIDPDPQFWLTDPDPAIFVIDLQDANKNFVFFQVFCLLLRENLRHFSKIKSHKDVTKQNLVSSNQGFSFYFCLMTEGSRSGSVSLKHSTRIQNTACITDFLKIQLVDGGGGVCLHVLRPCIPTSVSSWEAWRPRTAAPPRWAPSAASPSLLSGRSSPKFKKKRRLIPVSDFSLLKKTFLWGT